MTIDNTRDPRGRLQVADDDEEVCGAEHEWSGWTCQAEAHGVLERHRYYLDGSRAEWWEPFGMVVLNRQGEP